MFFVSQIFMAHTSEMEFNAASLASSTYEMIGTSICWGVHFAADTLLPQCFEGISLLLQKYICTNGITYPLVIINLIGNGINALLHYILIYIVHLGIRAPPIAITIAYICMIICEILFIRFSSIYKETWQPLNRDCLREWSTYLRLSAPGILATMSESWAFELGILFAARLNSSTSLIAQSVAYQIGIFLFLIGQSFAVASNIRIGQYLGANKPDEAKNCKNIAYTMGIIIVLIDMIFIYSTFQWIPLIFNISDPDALNLTRNILLVV
ncbi:unnamed protein product, partial [Didymodactylos carnosus]